MKTIGILGGTSWPSTVIYYRLLKCTELPLAMRPEASALPVLDTVRIQCERAFGWAVDGQAPGTAATH